MFNIILQLFLLPYVCFMIKISELQEGERMVYRSTTVKEELYKLPLLEEQQTNEYYLTEVYDIQKETYQLIIGRRSNSNTAIDRFETQLDLFERKQQQKPQNYSEVEFESLTETFGDDTRSEVQETQVYPYSAIARISSNCEGLQSICTGAFIARNVIITAAHCLSHAVIQCRNYQIQPAYQNSQTPFGTFNVTKIILNPLWDLDSEKYLDSGYGLLTIDQPVGLQTGWFGMELDCTDTNPYATIAGYPDDFNTSQKFVQYPIYNGTKMITTTCTIKDFQQCSNNESDGQFTHFCDTAVGLSGAPMWTVGDQDSSYIRGIHVGMKGGVNMGVYIGQNAFQWIQDTILYF